MTRSLPFSCLLAAILAVVLGCGSTPSEEPVGETTQKKADEKTVGDLKKQLTDIEAKIARKEAELDELRKQAQGIRNKLEAVEGDSGNVYTDVAKLFAKMPKSAYPKSGPTGAIERVAAEKWCNDNLVGKHIEWTETVDSVKLSKSFFEKAPFQAVVYLKKPTPDKSVGGKIFGKVIFGETQWSIGSNDLQSNWVYYAAVGPDSGKYGVYWRRCTEDEAKFARELKGKITCRVKITKAFVGPTDDSLYIGLYTTELTINGTKPKFNAQR